MLRLLFFLAAMAGPAQAVEAEWERTHDAQFGDWQSRCDARMAFGRLQQRCYVLRSDLYSPSPRIGAIHLVVLPSETEFVFPQRTRFIRDGLRIEGDNPDGRFEWRTNKTECLKAWLCIFFDDEEELMHEAMMSGTQFRFLFRDRFDIDHDVIWSLDGFEEAFDDMRSQAQARDIW